MEYALIAIAGFLFGSSFNESSRVGDWNKVGAPLVASLLSLVSVGIYLGKLKAGIGG